MTWHYQGNAYGIVRNYVMDPDQMTYVVFEVWSRGKNGEPEEFMADYRDRDIAVSKMDLLDSFRETMREALTCS